jgi:hypothetical protein
MKKQATRRLTAAVVGAFVLAGIGLSARDPQFRATITVQGSGHGAHGMTGDHRLTFSGPVALPGISLPAGTYTFRRPVANVLQVVNSAGTPYAMMTTVPVSRSTSIDRYQIVLGAPLADGAPRRIEAWFAAGEKTGQQLTYRGR